MLVTFTCEAYADITMFGDVAKRLLRMMGHSGNVPGAVRAADLPEAITSLRQALEHTGQSEAPGPRAADDEPKVSLSQRALPLLELLEAANRKGCSVMWTGSGNQGLADSR